MGSKMNKDTETKFEKPEIHLKHLKTSYTSQKSGLIFFKDYRLVKPRPHQTGQ